MGKKVNLNMKASIRSQVNEPLKESVIADEKEAIIFDDPPVTKLGFNEWMRDIWTIIKATIPTSSTAVLLYGLNLVNIIFLGQFNDAITVSAYGLANFWMNVSGYFFVLGFNEYMGVIVAQSLGKGDAKLAGLYFHRNFICVSVVLILLVILILFASDSLLQLMGIEADVTKHT
eukprot:TRINITY_DN6688_c0_g1_i1.p1 TRINITY_DN6688_c0_g1~~TRINITY_DN6688_c0_g1_i1.p1  ORF type:complete len:174 (-),score=38.85 TRINITY_DN6688_c0_g1_i1:142-663(-)